jgi:hypothetical protein
MQGHDTTNATGDVDFEEVSASKGKIRQRLFQNSNYDGNQE